MSFWNEVDKAFLKAFGFEKAPRKPLREPVRLPHNTGDYEDYQQTLQRLLSQVPSTSKILKLVSHNQINSASNLTQRHITQLARSL